MGTFIGVDLGWYGKPSGLSAATLIGSELHLRETTRLEDTREILDWIAAQAREDDALVAVDAPLVIPNEKGIRQAERDLNRDFRRFHAGCHPANLGRPFAANVIAFSRLLERAGFRHGAEMKPRQAGRFQIEVHPHAATVSLFGLDRIVKYKRGARDVRARELRRLRTLMQTCLPHLEPALSPMLPPIPRSGSTKPAEDMIDAVLCAFIAAHWWHWTTGRNTVYGSQGEGYIIVPHAPVGLQPSPARRRSAQATESSISVAHHEYGIPETSERPFRKTTISKFSRAALDLRLADFSMTLGPPVLARRTHISARRKVPACPATFAGLPKRPFPVG